MVKLNQKTFIHGTCRYAIARLASSMLLIAIFDLIIWRMEFERVYRALMHNQFLNENWQPYHEPELNIGLTISRILWEQIMFMILSIIVTMSGYNLNDSDFTAWVVDINRKKWSYRLFVALILGYLGWVTYEGINLTIDMITYHQPEKISYFGFGYVVVGFVGLDLMWILFWAFKGLFDAIRMCYLQRKHRSIRGISLLTEEDDDFFSDVF